MELITFKTLEISIASKLQKILTLNSVYFEIKNNWTPKGNEYKFIIVPDKKLMRYIELIELIKIENK